MIPSGQMLDATRFIVDVSTRHLVKVWAIVDGGESGPDQRYSECDETNNVMIYPENLCPEIIDDSGE